MIERWLRLAPVALLALAGCGADEAAPPGDPIEAKLSAIEAKIFARSCTFSSCHGTITPREGLSLAAGAAYDQLVDQPAKQVPAKPRVKPGDPAGSYLYEKLTSVRPASGVRMPQGQPALEAAALTAIRAWIAAGAPRD